ncbi:hypothetical protein M378DRAFT_172249 [Amanita muscaria Koide BX008]|uniref:Uncharacterized protein n=1 Tax=Amanita muscaria (strain Koide BX008) TaxID=946122 RepID=A0A0C2W743_AMAMK|nr:hypothetical protein M378DRAFT_172249 [Amanita muscaria Koide BX008]
MPSTISTEIKQTDASTGRDDSDEFAEVVRSTHNTTRLQTVQQMESPVLLL